MKKLTGISSLAVLCLLFISATTVKAQSPVQFGIKAGANFASYSDINTDLDARTGLHVGGFFSFNLPMTPFAIQPEVLYSQKGAEQGGTEINVEYLEIPVIAKLGILPAGPLQVNLQAGPYASFPLSSESGGVSIDIDDVQTDFGGSVGAGADISLGVSALTLDARYSFAFNDAFEDGQGKNKVFSIAAGIRF